MKDMTELLHNASVELNLQVKHLFTLTGIFHLYKYKEELL